MMATGEMGGNMGANRIITYAVEEETGLVISRVDSEVAYPVLDFEAIGQGGDGYEVGDFNGPTRWNLERFPVSSLAGTWQQLRWTRKIPVAIKNTHRAFWGGFRPLREEA
jgi:hypothetical protein